MRIRGNSEEKVLALLKKRLDESVITPFIPKKTYPFIRSGKLIRKELKICFPGYLYFASEKDARNLMKTIGEILIPNDIDHMFLFYTGVVHAEDKKGVRTKAELKALEIMVREYAMWAVEKESLINLMNTEYIIDGSKACMVKEKLKIISGPLLGYEEKIIKINKRRMSAEVDASLYGDKKAITVMLEII